MRDRLETKGGIGVRRSGVGRGLARLVYRVVRPVVRPVAWRVREFLMRDVRREISEMSERQEQFLSRGAGGGGMDAQLLAALERALLTLALEQGRESGGRPDGGSGFSKDDAGR